MVEEKGLLCNNIITLRISHFAFYFLKRDLYVKNIQNISQWFT